MGIDYVDMCKSYRSPGPDRQVDNPLDLLDNSVVRRKKTYSNLQTR